jgi:sugar phosphate permease
MGVGVVGFAASDGYALAFLSRATIGLGGSVIYISTLRYCASWYRPDEFATMTGLTSAMAGIGGILATTPLALSIAAVGWRATLAGVGVVGLVAGVAIYVGVRDTPADADLPSIEGVSPPSETSFRAAASHARRVLADPMTWVLGVVFLAFVGTTFTVLGLWGVPFLVDRYDLTVQQASTYVLIGNLGFLFGPPAMGRLSDRLGVRAPVIAGASLLFAAGYGLFVIGRPPLVVTGAVLFGATFVGGAGFITFTLVKNRHPAEASGAATGTVNGLGFVGVAALPVVMGWLLDAFWTGETVDGTRVYTALGYRAAFAVAVTMGLIAFAGSVWYWWAANREST